MTTIETELRQFNKIVVDCNEKEIIELKKISNGTEEKK